MADTNHIIRGQKTEDRGESMEKAVEIAGKKVVIRGLKWGELMGLKREGYNLSALDPARDNDELVVRTIETVCGDTGFLEDAGASEVYGLFREIHRLTYLSPDETKN